MPLEQFMGTSEEYVIALKNKLKKESYKTKLLKVLTNEFKTFNDLIEEMDLHKTKSTYVTAELKKMISSNIVERKDNGKYNNSLYKLITKPTHH